MSRGRCSLVGLYVLPEFRGLGVGTLLVEHALNQARVRGYRHVETTVAITRFFERFGFVVDRSRTIKSYKRKDPTPYFRVWMDMQ